MFNFFDLADRQRNGAELTRQEAHQILDCGEEDMLDLVAAGSRLRRAAFAMTVKVNYLVNVKSGLCPEDCGYCSQRLGSTSEILKYSWLGADDTAAQAGIGVAAGASRVCLVASGRGPSERDVDRVAAMVGQIKQDHPGIEVCVCLGLLREGQAERLREAGADAYNHNVNTNEARYADICSTHDYADRIDTVSRAQQAGLSACSGVIVGMGESDDDLIDAIFALRDLGSDSIPINFLMPFEGTPLESTWLLTPTRCLRILALARFACPTTEVRMAGGREMHLRSLQPLGLHLANSLFLGDYLTSVGQDAQADLDLIADSGFDVLAPAGAGVVAGGCHGRDHQPATGVSVPVLRQRGAGTTVPPNA